MIDHFLRDAFLGFVLPVLEYCSAVWCSAADTHLELLDREVSGARFLTGSVFDCDIAHRQSVAVLCMLYKIRYNSMHPLEAGYTRCPGRTSVYLCAASLQNLAVSQDFCSSLSVPLERSSLPRIRWCGTGGFQEEGRCFLIGISCSKPSIVFYYFSLSLLSVYRLVLWGWGLRTDRVYITLSQPCTAALF